MEKILSVAVPAYQAERTLDKCLSSMLVPGALDRLELIVIDDGSTDATGAIADLCAAQAPGAVTVIHQKNGGHGSGINAAVKIARGKYFRVVDADDWLISENLPAHLDELERCEADVVINGFHRVDLKTGRRTPVEVPFEYRGKSFSMEELSGFLPRVKNCFSIQGITYRRCLYAGFGWQLSEKVFYEDSEYITLPFCDVRSIFFSEDALYQYLVGNAQQSISDFNQVKRLDQLNRVFQRICTFYEERPLMSEPVQKYSREKLRGMMTTYLVTCLLRNPDRDEGRRKARGFLSWIEQNSPSLLTTAQREEKKVLPLHHLHVNGRSFDRIIDSPFYLTVRNQLRKLR